MSLLDEKRAAAIEEALALERAKLAFSKNFSPAIKKMLGTNKMINGEWREMPYFGDKE